MTAQHRLLRDPVGLFGLALVVPMIAGGVPIVITTLGFTFLGEALRDLFDPRLQRMP